MVRFKFGKPFMENLTETFHPNGSVESRGKLTNGKKEGNWDFYFDNGNYWGHCEFQKDKPHGFCEYYRIDGTIYTRGYYDKGKFEGDWEFYNENGELVSEDRYHNNKLVKK